jgi:hypothetical protein
MKVKELIEQLQKFDGELEILAHYNGDEYESDFMFLRLVEEDGILHFKD